MSTSKVQGLEGGVKVGRKRSKVYYGARQSKRRVRHVNWGLELQGKLRR